MRGYKTYDPFYEIDKMIWRVQKKQGNKITQAAGRVALWLGRFGCRKGKIQNQQFAYIDILPRLKSWDSLDSGSITVILIGWDIAGVSGLDYKKCEG